MCTKVLVIEDSNNKEVGKVRLTITIRIIEKEKRSKNVKRDNKSQGAVIEL